MTNSLPSKNEDNPGIWVTVTKSCPPHEASAGGASRRQAFRNSVTVTFKRIKHDRRSLFKNDTGIVPVRRTICIR